MTDRDVRTVYLDRYHDLEVPLILEILRGGGIFAVAKEDPESSDHSPYPALFNDRGIVLVEAGRETEARALLAAELPRHLESARAEIEELEASEGDPPDESS